VEVSGTVVTSNGPPIITTQPRNATAFAGGYSGLWVGVAGPGPFTYQWRKEGVDIPGAGEAMYNVDEVQPRHAGTYHVVVSNAFGTTISSNAILTVAAPLILRDLRRTSNDSVEFTVLGIAGESFAMESSADLVSWIPIRTNLIPASASMQLTDPTPGGRRFYRARVQ
jgi:hypothetical protein